MSTATIKKYVGATGDALAIVWQKLRGDYSPEAEPPVGAKDAVAAPGAAVAGISTGTLLLIALVWMLMKRRR